MIRYILVFILISSIAFSKDIYFSLPDFNIKEHPAITFFDEPLKSCIVYKTIEYPISSNYSMIIPAGLILLLQVCNKFSFTIPLKGQKLKKDNYPELYEIFKHSFQRI